MKVTFAILLFSFSSLFLIGNKVNKIFIPAPAKNSLKDTGYKLVWADEFNKNGPVDTTNWKFENGFLRNHELQWYQNQNARCLNGLLIIEGQKVHQPNPAYIATSSNWKTNRKFIQYTSSSINTSGKHAWKYGRFVMRGKININDGLWPAWWTLGVAGKWPSNGEIDIMEYYRKKLLANIACGTSVPITPKWFSKSISIDSLGGKQWATKFHIWRMDWDQNSIALYVDDVEINKVALSELLNKDGTNINPFDQPHFMLLNLAIGGDNGGNPAKTTFPKRFEIDYVRVYQK